jgi:hypothetical protein
MFPHPERASGHGTGRHPGARRGLTEPGDLHEFEREHQLPGTAGFQHILPEPHADAETVQVVDTHALSLFL